MLAHNYTCTCTMFTFNLWYWTVYNIYKCFREICINIKMDFAVAYLLIMNKNFTFTKWNDQLKGAVDISYWENSEKNVSPDYTVFIFFLQRYRTTWDTMTLKKLYKTSKLQTFVKQYFLHKQIYDICPVSQSGQIFGINIDSDSSSTTSTRTWHWGLTSKNMFKNSSNTYIIRYLSSIMVKKNVLHTIISIYTV